MRTFPLEIIREILHLTVLLDSRLYSEGPESIRQSILTPLLISRVCRTWRELALHDGRIWSYLFIDFRSSWNYWRADRNHVRGIFDTWIARSRKAPLNYAVYFDFKEWYPGEHGLECVEHIIMTLITQRHRWDDVDFVWGWAHYHLPPSIVLTDMPMLTSFRIDCLPCDVVIDLRQSRRLRKVDIRGNVSISTCTDQFQHLKEPSVLAFRRQCRASDVVRACQNFLEKAPFLEELSLYFEGGLRLSSSPLDNNRPVYPGLRLLRPWSLRGFDVFLDNVTLPSLQFLHYPSDSVQNLLRFVERSSPPLTYLSIEGLVISDDSFIRCLELLPILKQLKLTRVRLHAGLFRELTVSDVGPGTGSTICPALEALMLDSIAWQDYPDASRCIEALISMLESRAKIAPSFRNIEFFYVEDDSPNETSGLRRFAQDIKRRFNLWTFAQLFTSLKVGEMQDSFSDPSGSEV